MEYPVQLIRLTDPDGTSPHWIMAHQIIHAKLVAMKAKPDAKDKEPKTQTLIFTSAKENDGKIFVKEHPDEINMILRSMKKTTRIEKTVIHK